MQDPIVPPYGHEPSSESPTPQQDHAVLAWLAVEADLPNAVQLHLLDALNAWSPQMGPHLFPTEPGWPSPLMAPRVHPISRRATD